MPRLHDATRFKIYVYIVKHDQVVAAAFASVVSVAMMSRRAIGIAGLRLLHFDDLILSRVQPRRTLWAAHAIVAKSREPPRPPRTVREHCQNHAASALGCACHTFLNGSGIFTWEERTSALLSRNPSSPFCRLLLENNKNEAGQGGRGGGGA